MIKTYYTGSVRSFKKVTSSCLTDIVIAGGPKMESIKEVFKTVREALDGGAIGVAFGRNIWQSDDPKKMCKSIRSIVHEDSSTTKAMKLFER